jgi:RNA polymerase sigma factor (sigma-70 family)
MSMPCETGHRHTAASSQSRGQTVLDHLPLVRAAAVGLQKASPACLDVDGLVYAGILGLIEAVVNFDDPRNAAFPSYAKLRIQGSMLDSLRELDWEARQMRNRENSPDEGDAVCAQPLLHGALARIVESLPRRDQVVVCLHYKIGMDAKEIGRIIGATGSQVSRIHRAALHTIGAELVNTWMEAFSGESSDEDAAAGFDPARRANLAWAPANSARS